MAETWVTTSAINVTTNSLAGCGTTSDALIFGGYPVNTTLKWNGSAWATTTVLIRPRVYLAGCGTTSGALSIAGNDNYLGNCATVEKWNGSTWTTTGSVNQGTQLLSGCGTTGAALIWGGFGVSGEPGDGKSRTEKWAGSSWVTTTVLPTTRYRGAGCGTTSDALTFGGGSSSTNIANTLKWNGSAWATTTNVNLARWTLAGCGTTSDALCFGGYTGTGIPVENTEKWNGSSWVTTSALNVARYELGGCGTTSDALNFCSHLFDTSTTNSRITERWTGLTLTIPIVTTQDATDVIARSCTGNGNITATGGVNATRRGFCYKVGTSGDPTISDSIAYDNGDFGTGAFNKSITGLLQRTGYRIRAYATNSVGTAYGVTVQATTPSRVSTGIVMFYRS